MCNFPLVSSLRLPSHNEMKNCKSKAKHRKEKSHFLPKDCKLKSSIYIPCRFVLALIKRDIMGTIIEDDSFTKPLGRWPVFYYGMGHMLNDITAACWFTYLLLFLTDIGLSPRCSIWSCCLYLFFGLLKWCSYFLCKHLLIEVN